MILLFTLVNIWLSNSFRFIILKYMKVFGDRLRQLRKDVNLSAKELGKIIGVRDVAIINWENDVNDIKGESIVKLAKYFGISSDYLLGLEDQKKTDIPSFFYSSIFSKIESKKNSLSVIYNLCSISTMENIFHFEFYYLFNILHTY